MHSATESVYDPSLQEIRLKKDRQTELEQQKDNVHNAYINARVEHQIPGSQLTQEMAEEYNKFNAMLSGKANSDYIDNESYQPKLFEVITRSSHDYLQLLKLAVREVTPWKNDLSYIDAVAIEMFEHEMDHAVPELNSDQPQRIIYGVHFYKDAETQVTNMFPFIFVEGISPVGQIRDSMTNVEQKSEGDIIITGKNTD